MTGGALQTSANEADRLVAFRLVAEIRALQSNVGRDLWQIGKRLEQLHKRRSYWEPKWKRWDVFTQDVLGLTGPYVYKLIDVSKNFTEDEVKACGTAKLIKILPVPKEARPALVEIARRAPVAAVRAAANRVQLAARVAGPAGARPTPLRETGRRPPGLQMRPITHVAAGETLVALYAGASLGGRGERAKSVGQRPRGRLLLGATAYVVELRETEQGLVLAVTREDREA
jgi:hypothetical protein